MSQAGLSIAARLAQLQVDTLILKRVSATNRPKTLSRAGAAQPGARQSPALHGFHSTWPTYIPQQACRLVRGLCGKALANYWTGTEFEGGRYDEQEERWSVMSGADGSTREMHPRHVVMAMGERGFRAFRTFGDLRNLG